MKPVLEVKALTHTYSAGTPFEHKAIEDVNLEVMPGEFLGIIGHTGSGKSTLIQHLNGLLRPTGGEIRLDGEDIWAKPKEIRRVRFQVGLVFQYPEYQLFEETVFKDISFGPKNMGLEDEEVERRVRQAAAFAGIDEEMLEKSPFDLSGGQKRRVAIAGVIAMEPKVLILDEPTAGLDPRGREAILAQLRDYHRQKGYSCEPLHGGDCPECGPYHRYEPRPQADGRHPGGDFFPGKRAFAGGPGCAPGNEGSHGAAEAWPAAGQQYIYH